MRYLKNKISKAQQFNKEQQQEPLPEDLPDEQTESQLKNGNNHPSCKKRKGHKKEPPPPKNSTSCKNIMKNYSRAIVRFAVSGFALPYITETAQTEKIKLADFREFLKSQQHRIHCIKSLRKLLIIDESDKPQLASFKRIFKVLCVIFLKFFCVNWIFNSKVGDKIVHLNYRFRILRRIKDPEHFTYLEDFSRKE